MIDYISILTRIEALLAQQTGSGGSSSNVTVTNTPLPVTETSPITGSNLESTQQLLLAELLKSTDFTTDTLIDSGNSNQLIFRKEQLDETTGTYTITYEDINGNSVTPTGPLLTMPELELQVLQSIEDFSTGELCNNYSEVSNITELGLFPPGSATTTSTTDSNGEPATNVFMQGQLGGPIVANYQTPKQSNIISAQLTQVTGDNLGNLTYSLIFGEGFDIETDYVTLTAQINASTGLTNFIVINIEDSVNGSSSVSVPLTMSVTDKLSFYYLEGDVRVYINDEIGYITTVQDPPNLDDNIVQYNFGIDTTSSTIVPDANFIIQENSCSDSVCTTCDMNNNLISIAGNTSSSANSLARTIFGFTDFSGTITAASTSQTIIGGVPNRNYLLVQNVSDTDIWLNFGADATIGAGSIKIVPNGHYELTNTAGGYMNTESVNLICSQANKPFTIKEA